LTSDKDRGTPRRQSADVTTEDEMRIFQRLRGRERDESGIERKLVETVAMDLLRRIDQDASVTEASERKATCCSCCSAGPETA
jgi:hypothetical protein